METHRPRHGDTGAVVEKETTGLCGDTIPIIGITCAMSSGGQERALNLSATFSF